MAGIKGLKFRALNTHRHRQRTDKAYAERQRREDAQYEFRAECERRRNVTRRVPFGMGYMTIPDPERFTLAECYDLYSIGLVVPLDLVPYEYWRVELPSGQVIHPHSEEWLGESF